MIRRLAAAVGLLALPAAAVRLVVGRAADRLVEAPRTTPEEATLGPHLDALGGEVVRLRSRDGLRLAGRWLPADPSAGSDGQDWAPDPREAILLLHGWSGSVAPDVVEYGPFLRRTAGVLGLDFRGHGGSDAGLTSFGLHEVEDVAGALTWLGDRGVNRVALFGTSMGGVTALAAIAVLGDGSLPSADVDVNAPAHDVAAPRPAIVAAVADSVAPELTVAVGNRMRIPFRRFIAARMFETAGRRVDGDIRATEPIRIIGLTEPVPVLLVHGDADGTIPLRDARRLVAAAPDSVEHMVVAGGGHSGSHGADPAGYETRVTRFLRAAFLGARDRLPIIGAPMTGDAFAGGGTEGD